VARPQHLSTSAPTHGFSPVPPLLESPAVGMVRGLVHAENWLSKECRRRNLRRIHAAAYVCVALLGTLGWSATQDGSIETSDKDIVERVVWGWFLVLWVLGLMPRALRALQYLEAPESHPTIERILRRGEDLASASARIQEELRSPVVKAGPWRATQRYLVYSSFFSFEVSRFDEIVWSYALDRHGSACFGFLSYRTVLAASKRDIEAMLTLASTAAPWAIHGANWQVVLFAGQYSEGDKFPDITWERQTHDVKVEINLTPEEAAAGVRRTVLVSYLAHCQICSTGDSARSSCHQCRGSNVDTQTHALRVDAPAGTQHGDRLVHPGQGIPATPYAGDLIVEFLVDPPIIPVAILKVG